MPEPGSPPPSEAPHGLTVDQVVAANIRKLREARQMTRDDLAQQITDLGGEDVSRWRVIDLEGKAITRHATALGHLGRADPTDDRPGGGSARTGTSRRPGRGGPSSGPPH